MTVLEQMEREPYRFDFYTVMRRIEVSLGTRPRIGDSAARRDETVEAGGESFLFSLGQDPWLEFPASNLHKVEVQRQTHPDEKAVVDNPVQRNRIRILVKFLGLTGPQGALPLAATEEAFGYLHQRDEALARFFDLFNQRFLQLFYRAWADSRPVAQHDRPDLDRFRSYVGAHAGIGSPPFHGLDTVPDAAKASFAGLLAPAAKSASRLRRALRGFFDVEVEIDEFVGEWLDIDKTERSLLGAKNSGLGADMLVGKAAYSVQDKIRIRIFVKDMAQYKRFLPQGEACRQLVDLVFFYAGDETGWDVELALPAKHATPARLGGGAALGWTGWMAPDTANAEGWRCDARFAPAERLAQERTAAAEAIKAKAAKRQKTATRNLEGENVRG